MKLSLISLTAFAAIALVGVGCQKVTVLDQDAKPVSFAAVQVTQKGADDGVLPSYTDFMGNVLLTENLADPEAKEMLVVTKSGYETRKVMRQKGDMSITIRATGTPAVNSSKTSTAAPASSSSSMTPPTGTQD